MGRAAREEGRSARTLHEIDYLLRVASPNRRAGHSPVLASTTLYPVGCAVTHQVYARAVRDFAV